MKIRLKLLPILRNRLKKITKFKRIIYWVISLIFLTGLGVLSLHFFLEYRSTPRLDLSIEDWEEVDVVSLSIMLSDESLKGFEGFADSIDVSIFLLSPNYGIIEMTIPISNASALVGRDFSFVSYNIDWSYSIASLYGRGLGNETRVNREVDTSNPYKSTFQMPTDIHIASTFHFTGNLGPLNISKSLVQIGFSMRLNQSRFNIIESFFPPPELQLSHAPFCQPQGIIQINDLGTTIERSSSETYSVYLLRRSDMYIEKIHFEQNISLILSVFLFTSFVSLLSVFLEIDKRLFNT